MMKALAAKKLSQMQTRIGRMVYKPLIQKIEANIDGELHEFDEFELQLMQGLVERKQATSAALTLNAYYEDTLSAIRDNLKEVRAA